MQRSYCEFCGASYDAEGRPTCAHQLREPTYQPKQSGEAPAGAARFVLYNDDLAQLLHLPPGVKIHHCFVPTAEWGAGVGFIVYTDEPGVLPECKPYQEVPYIWDGRVERVQAVDGRWMLQYAPIPPKEAENR